jgi:hypothetical protein
MLIIFAINFNKKLASYLRLTSITKIVNEMQGLGTNVVVFADVGNNINNVNQLVKAVLLSHSKLNNNNKFTLKTRVYQPDIVI